MGKPARRKPVILGIIPARKGSKRLRNKNIRLLLGKPLIAYTIRAALKSRLLDKTIVSTDDKKIAKIARGYGAEVPFIRPKDLARDDTPTVPVLQHAVERIERKMHSKIEIIVVLQPTSPLRTSREIDRSIKKMLDTGADSLASVCKLKDASRPELIKQLKRGRLSPYLQYGKDKAKKKEHPRPYQLNGSLYLVKRDILMKKNTLYGKDTRALVMDKARCVDIDTQFDLLRARRLLRKYKKRF
ncbi:cytidylyltransferase domain-containing protein [Candidatus Omnitrophota bacterium]